MISSFAPSPALAPYVINLLAYDIGSDALGGSPLEWVVYPDTASVACFLFGDVVNVTHKRHVSRDNRSGISGFQTRRFEVGGSGRQAGVIARLTACGARCLYPCPANSLVDRRVAYRDLIGHTRIESLEDQLYELGSADARVKCVDSFLLSQLRPGQMDRLVKMAAVTLWKTGGMASVKVLAGQANLSVSALERRFSKAVGVGPKAYARVMRLQRALSHYGRTGSWVDAAAYSGFADQSHLIRECHDMLSESPATHWTGRDVEARNRIYHGSPQHMQGTSSGALEASYEIETFPCRVKTFCQEGRDAHDGPLNCDSEAQVVKEENQPPKRRTAANGGQAERLRDAVAAESCTGTLVKASNTPSQSPG